MANLKLCLFLTGIYGVIFGDNKHKILIKNLQMQLKSLERQKKKNNHGNISVQLFLSVCLCLYIHPASVLERAYNLKTVREERVFMFGYAA